MALQIKMIDFQVSDMRDEFSIQMYGLDESRKTYSITVNHFNPLYILKYRMIGLSIKPMNL